MKTIATLVAAGALALAVPSYARPATPGDEVIARIEARWGGVMTKIRGWNAEALRQFRSGYRDYPLGVLEKALEAETFEQLTETLDAQAAVHAQQLMQKAYPKVHAVGRTLPGDASDPQVAEAKGLAAKSLGDDARDLVFIPITPCTVWDTRFASNGDSAGIIGNATTKRFYSHLDGAGGSFAAYGGNPSCPETAQNFIGVRPFAVMMTVYINDATAQGWLTLYRDGDPDPSFATISVYYSPGPTRTQTVISKSSRGYGSGAYDIAATSRFANTHASASITGYFVKVADPGAFGGNISMVPSTATVGNILKGGDRFIHNSGAENTYMGTNAGTHAIGAIANVAMGYAALGTIGTASNNIAVGHSSLFSTTLGQNNTSIGTSALYQNTVGGDNTALGAFALRFLNSGSNNTAIGMYSTYSGTTMNNNAALGKFSLYNLASGNANVAVGFAAGMNLLFGDNNVYLGSSGGANTESDTMRLGETQGRSFIAGVRGTTTGIADAIPVMIDSTGQLGTISSSAAAKDDVADMAAASSGLLKLRPVTFHYRTHGAAGRTQFGLIAEEVERVYPELVAKRPDGSAETVMYHFIAPMLLNEHQKLRGTVESQAARIEALERELAHLKQTP